MRQALSEMSDDDNVRLLKAATYHSLGTSSEPDDLIQESIRRLLDSSRNWPDDVSLTTFLSNVMKSIAWADRQQSKSRPRTVPIEKDDPSGQRNNVDASIHLPSAEDVALMDVEPHDLLDRVLGLFEDDEDAFMVLTSLSDGQTAQEIREQQGLDNTSYATIRRRIRRKIDKAVEEGKLHGK